MLYHRFFRAEKLILALLLLLISAPFSSDLRGDEPNILTRVVFQDDDAKTVRWADLLAGSPPKLGPVQTIAGFPKLDAEKQSLVQMGVAEGMILVGVRDEEDGKLQSGWVLIDSGVRSEDHGDHSHSTYESAPKIVATQLDNAQGNPAHLYVYDNVFYLANDKLNGYTRIDPKKLDLKSGASEIVKQAQFVSGGGGHITLAAVDKKVGYSSWIDRSGERQGQVDVSRFSDGKVAYSLKLPSGGIHGATSNSGKVFFAPSDGICWVEADLDASLGATQVKTHHLSLGKEASSDKPLRTGAFTNLGHHVLFVTGKGAQATLCTLDAQATDPQPTMLPLGLEEGASPVGPMVGYFLGETPIALLFHDHPSTSDAKHYLSVVELDPNRDGLFADAAILHRMEVGRSRVSGHAGHHDASILADQKHALLSNPGDGTLVLVRPRRAEEVATFQVGGAPSKVETIGGPSGH